MQYSEAKKNYDIAAGNTLGLLDTMKDMIIENLAKHEDVNWGQVGSMESIRDEIKRQSIRLAELLKK